MFIDPIALHLGPIQVHWYGIIIATAVLAGALLGTLEARRRGEDPDKGWSMLLLVIVTSIVGARLYHVIHEWGPVYSKDPLLIPPIWTGGIGIPGAIIGAALATWPCSTSSGTAGCGRRSRRFASAIGTSAHCRRRPGWAWRESSRRQASSSCATRGAGGRPGPGCIEPRRPAPMAVAQRRRRPPGRSRLLAEPEILPDITAAIGGTPLVALDKL